MYLKSEPTEFHIFEFNEIRKPTSSSVNYDEIATLTLTSAPRVGEKLDEKLHNWTLSCLQTSLFDIGLYHGICNRVDADGTVLDTLSSILICWDGHQELFTHVEPAITVAGGPDIEATVA